MDVAPPRWRLNGRWYCAFPEIRDCAEPGKIPMKPIAIEDVKVLELGLGRSIYSPEQLEEFARFQESQGTRRAFLAESAERAYNTRADVLVHRAHSDDGAGRAVPDRRREDAAGH